MIGSLGAMDVIAASVMQAHRGGLVQAAGSGATMVTASRYGAVTLWPEAELRSIAEGAGFVLPTRAQPGISSSGGGTGQATISQVSHHIVPVAVACVLLISACSVR